MPSQLVGRKSTSLGLTYILLNAEQEQLKQGEQEKLLIEQLFRISFPPPRWTAVKAAFEFSLAFNEYALLWKASERVKQDQQLLQQTHKSNRLLFQVPEKEQIAQLDRFMDPRKANKLIYLIGYRLASDYQLSGLYILFEACYRQFILWLAPNLRVGGQWND